MKKIGTLLLVLAMTGMASAAEDVSARTAFAMDARNVIDCPAAREAAVAIATNASDPSLADAHQAATIFDTCANKVRTHGFVAANVQRANYLRLLNASALLFAAQAEIGDDRRRDLVSANAVLERLWTPSYLSSVVYGHFATVTPGGGAYGTDPDRLSTTRPIGSGNASANDYSASTGFSGLSLELREVIARELRASQ